GPAHGRAAYGGGTPRPRGLAPRRDRGVPEHPDGRVPRTAIQGTPDPAQGARRATHVRGVAMKDEPVDLGPLKLSEDPVRRERLKARIRAQARQELARRAARDTLTRVLARWFRPVLVVSGLVFAHAIAVLLLAPAS